MRLAHVPDAKITSFASSRERLKRGLIVMRKSDASETVLGRQKRPISAVQGGLPAYRLPPFVQQGIISK